MLISEFAKATALTPDTIRFYVRRGLFTPGRGTKGGRHPYQVFDADHVRTAQIIRIGQTLGLSLTEIGRLLAEEKRGQLTPDRLLALMTDLRDRLRHKAGELGAMADYVDAKIAWMEAGSVGPQPNLSDYLCAVGREAG